MIWPMLAMAILTSANEVVETPRPEATTISFVAIGFTGPQSPRDRAVLEIVMRALPRQTIEYGLRQIDEITTGGTPVRTVIMPDHVRISFETARGGLKVGASLLESLLCRPVLNQEDLDRAWQDLRGRNLPAWNAALDPTPYAWGPVTQAEATAQVQKLFNQNTWIGVGGAIQLGEAKAEWSRRAITWTAPTPVRVSRNQYPAVSGLITRQVSWLELQGPTIPAADAAWGTGLLAATALGTGKGSSLHRIVRERERLSYRQEAVLWPTPEGWCTRLILLQRSSEADPSQGEKVTALLREDVNSWQDSDRLRALRVLRESLAGEFPLGALYLEPSGPIGSRTADETFMAAYFRAKTGRTWNREALLAGLEKVSLDELKQTALEFLNAAKLIRGLD
ncbi:MAG: hypothetical protein ACOYON_10220 [Fimbriimonas sp.]